jgi:sugar phosphate isomerase/epimerase
MSYTAFAATMNVRFLLATLLVIASFCVSTAGKQAHAARVGYCASLAEIDAVKLAGFDYIELRTSEIAALSDPEYEKLAEKLKRIELPVPVTYLFIPADIKLTGLRVNKDQQMDYVQRALDRVSKLGATTVVFGSGPAR